MPIHETYFKVSLHRPSSGGNRQICWSPPTKGLFFHISSHTLVEWKYKNIKNSGVIMLRKEDILFGLQGSCMHRQKKKTIKVRAYLLVDMPKYFATKLKSYLFLITAC